MTICTRCGGIGGHRSWCPGEPRTPAPALSPAEAARVARFDAAPTPPEVVVETVVLLLDEVRETAGLGALVEAARREGLYCCSVGCGSGGCESCPCCCAGWCVSGLDGLPEDPEDRARWLEVAAEHNPLAAAIAADPSPAEEAVNGVALIAAERRRQIEAEGWTPEHDAEHNTGRLALAAAVYAVPPEDRDGEVRALWPWRGFHFKPTPNDRVCELVKAGALIAAEIDRLRAALASPAPAPQGGEQR